MHDDETETAKSVAAVVPTPEYGLVRRQPKDVVLMPVMDTKLAKQRMLELQQFCNEYLQESMDGGEDGGDYGIIPETKRKTLLKSGAEKLCDVYGLADEFRILAKVEDFDHGLFDYTIECRLIRKTDEMFVGSGLGSCSSFESRYRWRNAKRRCPACHQEAIIKGREEYGGGWVCFKKAGGCGAKYHDTDPAITSQTVGRVENPDIIDTKNTVLKMAKKRAKVDAVIAATRSSGIFSQDLDDIAHAVLPDVAVTPVAVTAVAPPPSQREDESHAQKIARAKQAHAAAAAPAKVEPPPPAEDEYGDEPAEAPPVQRTVAPPHKPSANPVPPDGCVFVTGINVRNGPMVMKDGVSQPSWGPLYVIAFSTKVKASDSTMVADATTFDVKIAKQAEDARDAYELLKAGQTSPSAAGVAPAVVPGKKKGNYNLMGFN